MIDSGRSACLREFYYFEFTPLSKILSCLLVIGLNILLIVVPSPNSMCSIFAASCLNFDLPSSCPLNRINLMNFVRPPNFGESSSFAKVLGRRGFAGYCLSKFSWISFWIVYGSFRNLSKPGVDELFYISSSSWSDYLWETKATLEGELISLELMRLQCDRIEFSLLILFLLSSGTGRSLTFSLFSYSPSVGNLYIFGCGSSIFIFVLTNLF